MAQLSRHQRRNAAIIISQGKRMGAKPKVIKAALQAAWVESQLTNVSHGDRDSLGVFQQRPSQGWGTPAQVTNVQYAAKQFYRRAIPLSKQGLSGGRLAQAVQRSAYPERYGAVSGIARSIAKGVGSRLGEIDLGAGGGGPAQPQTEVTYKPRIETSEIKPPEHFALAGPTFPAQTPEMPQGGGVVQEPQVTEVAQAGGGGLADMAGLGAQGQLGRAILEPGADRPGVSTKRSVLRFVRQVSGIYGKPLRIGTGTQHDQMTVNGTVSDHWGGHAADIPATGQKLIRIGQAALMAAGWSRAKARKAKGGLYNVNGHQIIFNTGIGGNHYNHVHVSG